MNLNECKIAVIGLGYVGLPLAVEFGKEYSTIGFDIKAERVNELRAGNDRTRELTPDELTQAHLLELTHDEAMLKNCNVFIVTVPTPIRRNRQPNLHALLGATQAIAKCLKKNDVVIYESTVYPGATEEVCVPKLEAESGLKFNEDFFCGYSPERINPGDKEHRLKDIVKVTSGSTPQALDFVDALYQSIISAGTCPVSSIKVAEAAKVIENTQRDVNIGLINELALIFNKMDIDTEEVLLAAGSKWNFLPFRPGLVGGHCIGVDPYYLTYKAQSLGYHPEIILAGRRLNDNMAAYAAEQLIKAMLKKRIQVNGSRVLILGLAFKENCPDIRNTKVVDMVSELEEYGVNVDLHDPWVSPEESKDEYGFELVNRPENQYYDGVILAVGHKQYHDMGPQQLRQFGKTVSIFYDLKSAFSAEYSDLRL